jgi:uncharacterized membrane protein HdeD (DUF308 family)
MGNLSMLHQTNILIHVVAGSLALLTGIIALIVNKRKKSHRNAGRVFLILQTIVILTGLLGVFVFKGNSFLLVITVLSGYLGFSGYRTLQTRSNHPKLIDIWVALLSLSSVIYYLYYYRFIGMIWAPVVIYSTIGYFILIVAYDFIRYLIPASVYANLWLYEHIFKMVSSFSGLLAAFSGTVFPQYQPYSQLLPSVLSYAIIIGFTINEYSRYKRFKGNMRHSNL